MSPGAKRPNQHTAIPTDARLPASMAMTAPKYAEKLNSGPGRAYTTPNPAKNWSLDNHDSDYTTGHSLYPGNL